MKRILAPAFVLLALAGTAQAHPKLLAASPAANAVVATPQRIELQFSEALVAQFSGADLVMPEHGGMKVPVTASVGKDGRTLVLTPRAPLTTGRYSVAWHVVSADTHRIAGTTAFTVK